MAADIVPALMSEIETSFTTSMMKDRSVRQITNRIRDGTANFKDAKDYAERTGVNLSRALSTVLKPDNLPDGRLYYNIATRTIKPGLKNNYDLVNDIADQVQAIEDEAANIGINATHADFPDKRINGLIDKITEEEITPERIMYWLGEPIINNSEAFFDDFIKRNADFRQQAGYEVAVSRILAPGCCEWCASAAGKGLYEYGEQPDDFFRRHEFCRCTVTYINEHRQISQDVWSKRVWESTAEEIRQRETGQIRATDKPSAEQIKALQTRLLRDRIKVYNRQKAKR